MSQIGNGWSAALFVLLVSLVAHEPWRWAGLYLGRSIDVSSQLFQWVRCVATALVSGLIMRLILFPAGALAGVPLALRLAAFAIGIAVFFVARRNLAVGVAAGSLVLVAGQWLLG
jgi:hypothetical protein